MSDTTLSDSAGNRAALGAINCPAVLASGITIAMATAGDDYTGIVGEKTYAITVDGGFCLFSLTGVTSTAANREYCCGDGQTIIIHVPHGYTTLYCESDTDTTNAYLRELEV